GCRMVCLASGGKLMQIARHHQFPLFVLPKGFPPRAALGFSLGVLLRMFVRMGIGTFGEPEVKEAVRRLEQLSDAWSRPAKSDDGPFGVAQGLTGKIPLIYADAHALEPVGIRWKTQLNENSKTHAFFTPMPEMNHNEINGWEPVAGTKTFYKSLMAVLLRTPEEHPRVALRMDITQRLILKNEGSCIPVHAEGKDFLNRLLYLVAFGDWVSLYLALLYGTDPTEIVNIDHLKKKLSL
ncbi:MAG TPA: SIS domain-containing protein, partial [bacterium]